MTGIRRSLALGLLGLLALLTFGACGGLGAASSPPPGAAGQPPAAPAAPAPTLTPEAAPPTAAGAPAAAPPSSPPPAPARGATPTLWERQTDVALRGCDALENSLLMDTPGLFVEAVSFAADRGADLDDLMQAMQRECPGPLRVLRQRPGFLAEIEALDKQIREGAANAAPQPSQAAP